MNRELAIKIIEEASEEFLKKISKSNGLWIKSLRHKDSDFPLLHPANDNYFEYQRQEKKLEWYIRNYLVNRIIKELFERQNVQLLFPDENSHIQKYHASYAVTCDSNNHEFEALYPFEFIMNNASGDKVGYRYLFLSSSEYNVEEIFSLYGVSKIIIIDWSDTDSMESEKHFFNTKESVRDRVGYITVRKFFNEFFSDEIYQLYVEKVRDVVKKANEIIGFETIPKLALSNVSSYKLETIDFLKNHDYKNLAFVSNDGTINYQLDEKDYNIIYERFVKKGYYKALTSACDFAVSFFTSEYLYGIFKSGYNFDYTAVVSGYLKSVEQLAYLIMKEFLKNNDDTGLLIKRKPAKKYPRKIKNVTVPNPVTNAAMVPFVKDYENFFDITLTPLLWCLHDNGKWCVSSDAVERIHSCLCSYSQDCRNDHFHKDNINQYEEVIRIRDNTILCLFYLIGGCDLGDDNDFYNELFKIRNDDYDRLYKKLASFSMGHKYFYIRLSNDIEIKAVRLQQQEEIKYDSDGFIMSNIKFVKVNDSNFPHLLV